MGILNRTPDSFFDRGRYWDLDAFLPAGPSSWSAREPTCLDVGGIKAGPGSEVSGGRGAGPGGTGDRRPPTTASTCRCRWTPGERVWPSRPSGPVPWWATTSAASPTPTTCPRRPASGAAVVATHIRLGPRIPDPDPHYDDVVAEVEAIPGRPRRSGPAGPAFPTAGSSWTPGWTSARRPRSRRPCCELPTGWRLSAGRCCSRPPTSRFWASFSASSWPSEPEPRPPPTPSGSASGAGSCAPTTSERRGGCATPSPR